VLQSLHREIIRLKGELAKFGVVGGIGAIIDATVITYLGSRFWTFRHRVNQDQAIGRETGMFIALNVVGLVIAEVVIAITSYGLDLKGHLAYDAASVLGTGLGTIFRYFSYKKWVFTAAPEPVPAVGYYGPAAEHLEAAAEAAD
jgi:putative flippase GtrA